MIKNKSNIIRQPYGPDGTRGFKNHSYRLVPLTPQEIEDYENHFVVKEAFIPKEYLFNDIWLSKIKEEFLKVNVYLTKTQLLFYDLDNKLIKILNLNDGYLIKKRIINNNYYIIFCRMVFNTGKPVLYSSTMYRIKDKYKTKQFWKTLSSLKTIN